jgi:nucleoside-diphosphate-sugar epimerase
MNVLIVGGAGYVGGAVTDVLQQESRHAVRIYDRILYEDSFRKPVDFVYGDVRDRAALEPQLAWADAVVWLAAIVGDGACQIDPETTITVNQETVEWLARTYDRRIVFMSTCSVYGAQDNELDEDSPKNPLSLYAATKLKAEAYLEGKNAITFRLGTLFGVGDLYSRIRMDLVVNYLTVKAHQVGRISVFGGEQFRPLLHVKDVARATARVLDTSHTGVYNLARQNVRIIDLSYQIRNHFPDLVIERTDRPFQDTRNYRVSSRRAKETWGFDSVHSIDDGIEEIKLLVESRRIKDLDHARYSNQRYLMEQPLKDLG